MSVAELIEQINGRRNELDESRGMVSNSLLRVLEDQIYEMESALASGDAKRVERLVFIDECGG